MAKLEISEYVIDAFADAVAKKIQETKADAFDKMRAEIEREQALQRAVGEYDITRGIQIALEIIDKYRPESEKGAVE